MSRSENLDKPHILVLQIMLNTCNEDLIKSHFIIFLSFFSINVHATFDCSTSNFIQLVAANSVEFETKIKTQMENEITSFIKSIQQESNRLEVIDFSWNIKESNRFGHPTAPRTEAHFQITTLFKINEKHIFRAEIDQVANLKNGRYFSRPSWFACGPEYSMEISFYVQDVQMESEFVLIEKTTSNKMSYAISHFWQLEK